MARKDNPPLIWLVDESLYTHGSLTTPDIHHDDCVIMDKKRINSNHLSHTRLSSDLLDPRFGALRDGSALSLTSTEAIGLLSQYAGVGFMMGFFDVLAYPVFQNYLHMQGYQIASYSALINLTWSFKIFFGLVSDCFPIGGYHRRPYMVLGWFFSGCSCIVMALTSFPPPYYTTYYLFDTPREKYTALDIQNLNESAPLSGSFFILMSSLACLGYVMATVASDALVVQYAQREAVAIRGRLQTAVYIARDLFSVLPMLLVGFCLNDFRFGGEFTWSLNPNILFGIVATVCGLAAISAYCFILELPSESISFHDYLANLWEFLQRRVVWQICIFKLFHSIFLNYTSTLRYPFIFLSIWVEPLTSTLFLVFAQVLRLAAMFIVGQYALNWNWRWSIGFCTAILVTIDVSVNLISTWNIFRDQYFYSGLLSLEAIPSAMIFLFSSYLIVEVADVGCESLAFALLTSFSNLGNPLSSVLAKSFDSFLDADLDIIEDDHVEVRWKLTYSFLAVAVMRTISMGFLVLLPSQKAYVHLLKRKGKSKSNTMPVLVLLLFVVGFIIAWISQILSIVPSTSCMRLAGGLGCK